MSYLCLLILAASLVIVHLLFAVDGCLCVLLFINAALHLTSTVPAVPVLESMLKGGVVFL